MPYASLKCTQQQRRFVRAYVENDGNKRQAAISAGYALKSAGSTGYRLANTAHVQEEIMAYEKRQAERADVSSLVDRDWVLRGFKQIFERCMAAEPILDIKGEETGEFRFNATGANKSLEHLGKAIGMFEQAGSGSSGAAGIQINIVNYGEPGSQPQLRGGDISVAVTNQGDQVQLPPIEKHADRGAIVELEPIEVLIDDPPA